MKEVALSKELSEILFKCDFDLGPNESIFKAYMNSIIKRELVTILKTKISGVVNSILEKQFTSPV